MELGTRNPAGSGRQGERESQDRLWLSENLGALLVIFLGRDLISLVLGRQLLQALLFVRGDGRGRAFDRRERLLAFDDLWFCRGLWRWCRLGSDCGGWCRGLYRRRGCLDGGCRFCFWRLKVHRGCAFGGGCGGPFGPGRRPRGRG